MRNLNRLAAAAPRALAKHVQRNAVAYIALFVALAGSSYAAVSINGSQIRNHSINPAKFNPRFINGHVRAWALVRDNGHVIASAGRPRVTLAAGLPSEYRIFWGVKVGRCGTVASIDGADSRPTETVPGPGGSSLEVRAGYAVVSLLHGGGVPIMLVDTYNQAGRPTQMAFNVAVIC